MAPPAKNKFWRRPGRWLQRTFIAGLLVTVPIGITIWIIVWLFDNIDGFLQPYIVKIFGHSYSGVGFGVTIVIIFMIGAITTNVIGRRVVRWGESLLGRVPLIRRLYTALREIFQSFNNEDDSNGYIQVVLVEFPTKGMRTIGFITSEGLDANGNKVISVFIPHAPNPITGYMEIVREESIIRTNISVEEALKMVVSAGRMMPRNFAEIGLAQATPPVNGASGVPAGATSQVSNEKVADISAQPAE